MLPVEDFIAQYRGAAEELWLAGLVRAGYTRLDWSQTFDGPALSRQEKLSAIDQLIDAGCPLFPESISVLAPVIIELCDFPARSTSIRLALCSTRLRQRPLPGSTR